MPDESTPVRLYYPGLMAIRSEVARAQNAAARHAAGTEHPSRTIDDERELRNRKALRSAVLIVVFGLPIVMLIGSAVLLGVLGAIGASASQSVLPY